MTNDEPEMLIQLGANDFANLRALAQMQSNAMFTITERDYVRRWRVHARELDGSARAVGEWHDGPMPDMGTVAREASTILHGGSSSSE